jgi:hypothetical protein
MSDEMLRALQDRVAADLADERERSTRATMRSWSRPARLAVVAAAIAVVAGIFVLFLARADLPLYPGLRFGFLAGGYAAMALVAAWHSLRPLWLPPAPRATIAALFVAAIALPFVAALLPELPTYSKHAPSVHMHVRWMFGCWATGSAAGLVVLLVARALDRGDHRGRDPALLAALAASMVGLLALHVECTINFRIHLMIAHATLPLLFLGLARWLWRARDR